MRKIKVSFYVFVFSLLILFQVKATERIKIIDGDSLYIGRREIRLSGIDAPEYHQLCLDKDGFQYECGKEAFKFLKNLVGPDLKCRALMRDKYKREVAVCESNGVNLNQKMVASGWAVAYRRYTDEYSIVEKRAKKKKLGIWQGRFMKPELYRILQKKSQDKP